MRCKDCTTGCAISQGEKNPPRQGKNRAARPGGVASQPALSNNSRTRCSNCEYLTGLVKMCRGSKSTPPAPRRRALLRARRPSGRQQVLLKHHRPVLAPGDGDGQREVAFPVLGHFGEHGLLRAQDVGTVGREPELPVRRVAGHDANRPDRASRGNGGNPDPALVGLLSKASGQSQ